MVLACASSRPPKRARLGEAWSGRARPWRGSWRALDAQHARIDEQRNGPAFDIPPCEPESGDALDAAVFDLAQAELPEFTLGRHPIPDRFAFHRGPRKGRAGDAREPAAAAGFAGRNVRAIVVESVALRRSEEHTS